MTLNSRIVYEDRNGKLGLSLKECGNTGFLINMGLVAILASPELQVHLYEVSVSVSAEFGWVTRLIILFEQVENQVETEWQLEMENL